MHQSTAMTTVARCLFAVTTENGIEMSSKQILREKIVILANIWCNIFRYLCYCGGFFDPPVVLLLIFLAVFFLFLPFLSLSSGKGGCQAFCVNREMWKCVCVCVTVIVSVYWVFVCGIFTNYQSKMNTRERRACRKLIIKSQIYNDSNCNNNKHSRWAQCNSFPLLQFLLSSSSFSSLRCLAFNFHQFLASFPSPSPSLSQSSISISTFHMAINFLVVFHISLRRSFISLCFSIAKFKW